MTVRFVCGACAYEAPVPDDYAGANLKCPQCAAPSPAGSNGGPGGPTRACPFCAEPVRTAARSLASLRSKEAESLLAGQVQRFDSLAGLDDFLRWKLQLD